MYASKHIQEPDKEVKAYSGAQERSALCLQCEPVVYRQTNTIG